MAFERDLIKSSNPESWNVDSIGVDGQSETTSSGAPQRDVINDPELPKTFGGFTDIGSGFQAGRTVFRNNGDVDFGDKVKIRGINEQMLFGAATAPTTGVGIFLGKDGADYEFRAGDPAGDNIHWDGTNLNINGNTLDATVLQIATVTVSASAAELNTLNGFTGSTANLNTITDGSDATTLHTHASKTGTVSVGAISASGSTVVTHSLGIIPTVIRVTIGCTGAPTARIDGVWTTGDGYSGYEQESTGGFEAVTSSNLGRLGDTAGGGDGFFTFTITTVTSTQFTLVWTETDSETLTACAGVWEVN